MEVTERLDDQQHLFTAHQRGLVGAARGRKDRKDPRCRCHDEMVKQVFLGTH